MEPPAHPAPAPPPLPDRPTPEPAVSEAAPRPDPSAWIILCVVVSVPLFVPFARAYTRGEIIGPHEIGAVLGQILFLAAAIGVVSLFPSGRTPRARLKAYFWTALFLLFSQLVQAVNAP